MAKFSFEARNTDELSFNAGDTITIVTKCDGGWWEGCLGMAPVDALLDGNIVKARARDGFPAPILR